MPLPRVQGYFVYGIIHNMNRPLNVAQIIGEVIDPGSAHEGASQIIRTLEGPDLIEIVRNLLNTTLGVVGVVAVIMIIIGGFYYTTSQGSSEKVQKGKNTILYGIVGMIICLSAFAIVNFILASLSGS